VLPAGNPNSDVVIPSSVDTTTFDGMYALLPEASFASLIDEISQCSDPEKKANLQRILDFETRSYQPLRINKGVLTAGSLLIQEFSLRNGEITEGVLTGEAIWHEDIHDPGDCARVHIRLQRQQDGTLTFAFDETSEIRTHPLFFCPAATSATRGCLESPPDSALQRTREAPRGA
jgi:hypothetical protein